jgi:hypothetical protein
MKCVVGDSGRNYMKVWGVRSSPLLFFIKLPKKKKKNTPISTLCIKVSGGNLRSIKIKYILQYIDSLLSCSSFGIL